MLIAGWKSLATSVASTLFGLLIALGWLALAVLPAPAQDGMKLSRVGVYYHADDPLPTDAMTIDIRAIVWIEDSSGTTTAYTQGNIVNDGHWWQAGADGAMVKFAATPRLDPNLRVMPWPATWAQPTLEWQDMAAKAQWKPDTFVRKHWYERTVPSWNRSWGQTLSGRTLGIGLHRFKVRAVWGDKTFDSADLDKATRIAVKDTSQGSQATGLRRDLILYMSAFMEEPYEWGGEWFGGKASGVTQASATFVGGGDDYEGYGVDCSGLIYNAARLAGYGWRGKIGTSTMATEAYSTSITQQQLEPGDILIRPPMTVNGHKRIGHVIECATRSGDNITYINALGETTSKVLIQRTTISHMVGQDLRPRRLVVH